MVDQKLYAYWSILIIVYQVVKCQTCSNGPKENVVGETYTILDLKPNTFSFICQHHCDKMETLRSNDSIKLTLFVVGQWATISCY